MTNDETHSSPIHFASTVEPRWSAAAYGAMGHVAAGAAYELDPPLSRVLVGLRLLLDLHARADAAEPAAGSEPFALLQRALESAERLEDTVRALRAFTSLDEEDQGVDVHEAVEVAVHLTMNAIAPRASLLRRYSPAPRVRGSLGRVVQVLTSIFRNAAQSIPPSVPQANTITVQTGVDAEGRVTIDVIDTGLGIEPSELPFVCDPFFSTKPAPVSQGLGLAAARLAVLELGGDITIDSTAGRGTRVRTTWPAADGDGGLRMPVFESTKRPSRRVLCVAETAAGAMRLGDLAKNGEVEVLFAGWSDALDRLALGESFDLVLCEAGEARRVAFRERLALIAPSAAARTFALALLSRASGTFARVAGVRTAADSSDEIDLAPAKTAW